MAIHLRNETACIYELINPIPSKDINNQAGLSRTCNPVSYSPYNPLNYFGMFLRMEEYCLRFFLNVDFVRNLIIILTIMAKCVKLEILPITKYIMVKKSKLSSKI